MKDSIYSTKKMEVDLSGDLIVKKYKKTWGYRKRYHTEKKALNLLAPLEGIPRIVSFSDETPSLTLTRLNGSHASGYSVKALNELKSIMLQTIKLGVARHSLPSRDILVDENDAVGVVDFERATLKEDSWRITWHIAAIVAKFHTCRFIYNENPDLLSERELKFVNRGLAFRRFFKKYEILRDHIRNLFRKKNRLESTL